jgi:hypothetical protein
MLRGVFKKKKAVSAAVPVSMADWSEPYRLQCGPLEFHVGFTTRRAIESRLGPAVEYPAPGWRTWAAAGSREGEYWILSAIYRGLVLIGVEHYLTKTANVPRDTPPANGIYTLMPGEINLGNTTKSLPTRFLKQPGKSGGVQAIVYQEAFQARWPHGIALISGNDGRIERIGLYANHAMPTIEQPMS